ncbi:MAG: inositol monophosphatase [Planctomycetes bacterium]|nr:inositol monophosphatase [Planctomycetota bacterium]
MAPPEPLAFTLALATETGRLLMEHYGHLRAEDKSYKGRRNVLTVADTRAERLILDRLREAYPGDDIIAEETLSNGTGRGAARTWIVDPLDGTVNFAHRYPFFAVSIALWEADQPLIGVVHAPATGETFHAARGAGASLNGEPLAVTAESDLSRAFLATGFAYNQNDTPRNNHGNFCRLSLLSEGIRRGGCASLDLCYTAMGRFDAYWELFLRPWDVAAGGLIVREAGGRVTDFSLGERWLHGGEILASNGATLHGDIARLLE